MVDETTDKTNKEQMVVVLHRVTNDLAVYDEFLAVYNMPTTEAKLLTAAIQDIFLRLQLAFNKVRGQCYDGASLLNCLSSFGHRRPASVAFMVLNPFRIWRYGRTLVTAPINLGFSIVRGNVTLYAQ